MKMDIDWNHRKYNGSSTGLSMAQHGVLVDSLASLSITESLSLVSLSLRRLYFHYFYLLQELDGVELSESFAGNRLRKFFTSREFDQDRGEQYAVIRVRDAMDIEPEGATNDVMEEIVVEQDSSGNRYPICFI